MGEVPLSKWLMNRRMRTRLYGGVGRAGEKPALTRLGDNCSLYITDLIQVIALSSSPKYEKLNLSSTIFFSISAITNLGS